MYRLRSALFGTAARRVAALLIANAVFHGAAALIHRYIDTQASSPGLSFVLLASWMALGVIAALVTVIALGNLLFHPTWSDDFLRDEMADLDARISGEKARETTDDDDLAALHGGDSTIRFGLYFLAIAAANILGSNALAGGFLQRYSHPGVAIVHMRSDDPVLRREGMTMLASRLDFTVTPAIEEVVLAALNDPDEGVAARAAFVVGALSVEAAVGRLEQMIEQQPALAFTALIALGQVEGEAAREAGRRVARLPQAQAEPRALALMLGMLRVPAIDRLRAIYETSEDEDTRVAALWALGEMREEQLLDLLAGALDSPSLALRCAGVLGLEKLVDFDTSEPLKRAFEAADDPLLRCPEKNVPVQEGGPTIAIVPHRNYQLAIIRALATTDDPTLITWLPAHQEGVESRTHALMKKLWESLKGKDERGELNPLKRRVRMRRLQAGGPDAGRPAGDGGAAPDAGAPDGGGER